MQKKVDRIIDGARDREAQQAADAAEGEKAARKARAKNGKTRK
ncbi:hypothetical protein [Streptomyces yangpuensis]